MAAGSRRFITRNDLRPMLGEVGDGSDSPSPHMRPRKRKERGAWGVVQQIGPPKRSLAARLIQSSKLMSRSLRGPLDVVSRCHMWKGTEVSLYNTDYIASQEP